MLGGHILETQNNRICQICGLKSGIGRLKEIRAGLFTREFLKQYFNEKQNGYFQSGCLREVVAYEK